MLGVLVAVEGPSAAGKTTWCRAHAGRFVAEYSPAGREPDGVDLALQAGYWVETNSARWAAAAELERTEGVAVCDGDPLKLHYSWCLAAVGAASWGRFEQEYERVRAAFRGRRLGLVDVVFVSRAPEAVLRGHRAADPLRRRRSFDLHMRLREPLLEWYRCLERLDRGRVIWELPEGGLALSEFTPRPDRFDVERLDALVSSLPVPEADR
jgi:hypothetical protein